MADIVRDLARLEQEERAVSQRRRRLHERIDFIRGSGMHDPDSNERLARLAAEEKDVSSRRRELHGLIDSLRAEVLATRGTATPLGAQPKERLLDAPNRAYLGSMHV